MEIVVAIVQALLLVAAAPLMSGIARKIRAKMHSRQGASVFQDYYDLAKLWKRTEVRAGTAGLVTRIMPPLFLATFVVIAAGLPLITRACPVPLLGDVITVLYLMALPRFVFSLASIDSGASYTSIGGIRELIVGVLVEPALMLVLVVMALACGSTNVGTMATSVATFTATPPVAVVVAGVAFAIACYMEMGKVPFDMAEAEQEIQEGPLAELSGPSLAMLKLGMSVKQAVVAGLFIALFLPVGAAASMAPLDLIVGFVALIVKMLVVFLVVSVIENAVIRVRYKYLGRYTWFAVGIAALSFVFLIIGI
ncbi:MAG: NADH-quinone oxidoreductase subunit H [Eggerthellaceae bacterium]|nr:NADH-quinone oxidoreductase subunit H [Eggerthellaceae bacterium]